VFEGTTRKQVDYTELVPALFLFFVVTVPDVRAYVCVCVSLSLSLFLSLSLCAYVCGLCVSYKNINMLSHAYIRTYTHNHSHSHSYIGRRSQRDKVDIYTHIHITAATATLIFVDGARETVSDRNRREQLSIYGYGVATMSRMLKNTGLFAEYRSLL